MSLYEQAGPGHKPGAVIGTPVQGQVQGPKKPIKAPTLAPTPETPPKPLQKLSQTLFERILYGTISSLFALFLLSEYGHFEALGIPIGFLILMATLSGYFERKYEGALWASKRKTALAALLLASASYGLYQYRIYSISKESQRLAKKLWGGARIDDVLEASALREPLDPPLQALETLCISALKGNHASQQELIELLHQKREGFLTALVTLNLVRGTDEALRIAEGLAPPSWTCGTPYCRITGYDHLASAKDHRHSNRRLYERALRAREEFFESIRKGWSPPAVKCSDLAERAWRLGG